MLLPLGLRTFSMSSKQQSRIVDFMESKRLDGAQEGASGGRFTFSFTPTGLGQSLVIRDNISGEELDATEYESW